MAANVEERKVAALERGVQLLEHHVYGDPAVETTVGQALSDKHTADCLGCVVYRAEVAEKARVAAEAKAKADAEAAHALFVIEQEQRQKDHDAAVASEQAAAEEAAAKKREEMH